MEHGTWDEDAFFFALAASGARVLLIGRRALIALGLPVQTADIDLWVHIDDVEKLNDVMAGLDHSPNATPAEARARGRYVFENDQHIDVLVARAAAGKGDKLTFDEAWATRERVTFAGGATIDVPTPAHLIMTKRWAMRPKDILDIQLLEGVIRARTSP